MKVAQSYPARLLSPWSSPGQNPGVGSCSLLQGIFPIQGSNPGLAHCRQILNHLSHQRRSLRILEWVAHPFSRGSSQPRNRTQVSCTGGGFFTSWSTRAAHLHCGLHIFPAPRMICRCEPGSVKSWLSVLQRFPLHRRQFKAPSTPPGYPSGLISYCSRFLSRLPCCFLNMFCPVLWFFHWLFFLPWICKVLCMFCSCSWNIAFM